MKPQPAKEEDAKEHPLVRIFRLVVLRQWLLIGMGLVCLLAYFFPSVASHGGVIRAEYTILYGAVAIIFLISGLSIPHNKIMVHIRNWRLHLIVQGFSFLFIPALMVGVVHLIHATDTHNRIDTAILAGYIFLACLPTTIASNVVMTRAAGGDDAAALVEVLVANILGPFITPGWTITLLPASEDFDPWREGSGDLTDMYKEVFQELGLTVLLPLIVGQIIRWRFSDKTARILEKFHLAKVSGVCLIGLVWSSFSTCFSTGALRTLTTESVIFTIFFNIGLYLVLTILCFGLSRPPYPLRTQRRYVKHVLPVIPARETIAICFCGPAKTTGLGIPLLYAMFKGGDVARTAQTSVNVILYTTEQIFCAHFIVQLFRWWLRRVEPPADAEGGTMQAPGTGEEEDEEEGTQIDMAEVETNNVRLGREPSVTASSREQNAVAADSQPGGKELGQASIQ